MHLRVLKSDGSSEVYLHTKVIGSIAVALSESGSYQEVVTGHLAEAVTIYISRRHGSLQITSDEIHAMIEAVLSETGYEDAAVCLHEHRLNRQINRLRTEVIHCRNCCEEPDTVETNISSEKYTSQLWNKSLIVRCLEGESGLSRELSRAIAGAVEEKVLRIGSRRIFSTLVSELVANELWFMKEAEKALTEHVYQEEEENAGCHEMELVP